VQEGTGEDAWDGDTAAQSGDGLALSDDGRGGGAGSPSSVGGTYDNARAESVIGLTRPNCAPACSIDPSGSVALDDGVLVVRVVAPPGTAAGDSGRLAGSAGRWAG